MLQPEQRIFNMHAVTSVRTRRRSTWRRAFLPALLTVSLTGCGALQRTEYERPAVVMPAAWQGATVDRSVAPTHDAWWKHFQDPALDALVSEVLRTNNDLAAAALRVRRAQLQAGLARTAMRPTLSGSSSARGERDLRDSENRSDSFSATLSVGYEVDLWGKLARQRDEADWEAAATEEDRRAAALALIGTTLNLYWEAAFLNQQIATAEKSIDYAARTLELVRAQYEAGAVSRLELAEAERNLANQQAAITQLYQQRAETLNALSILLDGPPSNHVPVPPLLPDTPLPEVRPGVPAELLGRRPDLRAAELRLRSSLAHTDVVRTSYYPTLSLTGSLSSASSALIHVLQNPIAALGAGITLPFLQWREMQQNIAVSQVDYEAAVVQFRQALYDALAEVENALSLRQNLAAEARLRQEALDAATEAERLYEVRYRAGAVPLRAWLDAQEARRQAELAVARNRLQRYQAQVLLYQALGGDDAPAATGSPEAVVTP